MKRLRMTSLTITVESAVLGSTSVQLDSQVTHFDTVVERRQVAALLEDAAARLRRAYDIEEPED